ncbi:MAG: 30S ribosomal protein S21 [Thermogemmatispora sp.]|jgi:small subunit ribosomal protein S21|uniref:Small ribosomal subunit protein bS21 n=2 Tax=Thermogemmatispora TaxID=768669 RepID=A0A328VEA1_9CHLR|nr:MULTISPECIES: 30S ribosomal protein S21 [Thermogemmatispora]MBX5459019.1 30S ribosomal protein S21 [Thermogemmatispora sp.]RAQ96006.1 30S ribosomal protein S21 [Thermogemmatispora tikiterensis]GER82283.1 hypothetical protein KTAU_09210 [Thermogemmatispora aurantia]
MSEVRLNPDESFEVALKRFNRKVLNAGILAEVRRRKHYESRSDRRKRKAAVARRRRRRHTRTRR